MTPALRIAAVAVAAVVAVVAFLLLRPREAEVPARPVTSAATATPDSTATAVGTASPARTATPRPRPKVPTLTAERVRRLRVDKGETVRFAVRSATDEEIHVHGYDLSKPAPAGKTVRMTFEADIEGVFEIELERSATPIAELEVRP